MTCVYKYLRGGVTERITIETDGGQIIDCAIFEAAALMEQLVEVLVPARDSMLAVHIRQMLDDAPTCAERHAQRKASS